MINALRYSKMAGFRDKYRNMDVLLVDDIQFLVNKERTQEEFFHTFNALHECMRQIVIASDRPPEGAWPRSKIACAAGSSGASLPTFSLRTWRRKSPSCRRKPRRSMSCCPTDVALFIASNIRSNVRELEGALIRLDRLCLAYRSRDQSGRPRRKS